MVRGTIRCRDRRVATIVVGLLPSLLYVVRDLAGLVTTQTVYALSFFCCGVYSSNVTKMPAM